MKNIYKLVLALSVTTFVLSQSPFDAVKGKKEDISKRDLYAKHYLNDDGSYTALIGAGPIHYKKNGQFLDINHNITTNSSTEFPYANTTNLFESYYGATANIGVKNKTPEGEVHEFLNTIMYWEVNGQPTNTVLSSDVPVSIQNDKAYYNQLYGNISAEFVTLTGKRKLNYIIPNTQDLGTIPEGTTYLVFSEDIILPNNWTHSVTESGIVIKNEIGDNIYLYENPTSTDATVELSKEENTIFETQLNGNTLTIKTKVKTEWLLSSERVFPVKVDPTVNVYPDNTTNWTRSVASDGYDYADFQFGTDIGYFVRGFVKYNLTSISASATINSAVGYLYVFDILENSHYSNAFRFKNALDPTANSGAQLYNSASDFYSSDQLTNQSYGWKNVSFNSAGLPQIKNSFGDYISLCVDPGGSWHSNSIYKIRNHVGGSNGTERPYLAINYTVSSACSGTPTGGTASVSPSSGTHTTSYTANVSGSTSASGITYQWESAPSSSGPWTNVSGATTATYNTTASYSNGIIYYRRKITCTNSNQSAYSSVTSFTTTCSPSHTEGNCAAPGDCQYIGVSNVNLGTINNTTGYGNSSPAYNDYSSLSTDVSEGTTYSLKVTYKDGGYPANPGKIGAWIDWNNDGDFSDANEFIGIQSNVSNNAQITFTFNVPTGTTAGTKRMRIRSEYNDNPLTLNDACTILEYGETEDYRVKVVITVLTCSTLSNLQASIGTPANGLSHFLRLDWDALTGATGYDVQFSTDGTNYLNATPSSSSTNYADLDAGDYPDEAYWLRVRAKNATTTCDWTYVGPIYTAADAPEVVSISNAGATTLDITLQNETPVNNPSYTTYSIYCSSTGQFVQADGTLGSSEVWQTKSAWGSVTVSGLTSNVNYCFYAKAKNQDGHIVGGGNVLSTEDFTTSSNFSNVTSNGPTNKWWTPGSPTSGVPITYSSSGSDCSGGYVGFSGSYNNYHGTFLRSPVQNCTGMNELVMTFYLSNSYFSNHPNDKVTFNMWAPTSGSPGGTYISATSVNGQAGNTLLFSEVRSCKKVTVVYDLASVTDKSSIMYYLNFYCGYNNSDLFYYKVDNITLTEGAIITCATTSSSGTPKFHNFGGTDSLTFNNSRWKTSSPIFRLSHASGTATNYQIEINTSPSFSGTALTQTFNGTFAANTERNFNFSNAVGQLSNGTTYYVRARIDDGLGYGGWTTKAYSFTYNTAITEMEWYQTTQAQFQTGALSGTTVTGQDEVEVINQSGGNGVNNGSFNGNTNNWTVTGANTSWNLYASAIGSSDNVCSSCTPLPGSTNLRMGSPDFGTSGPINGDKIIVAQSIDLTSVDQITFDVSAWYNLGNPLYDAANTVLKFKIGGTLTNAVGSELDMTAQTQPISGSYTSPHTVTVNTSSITGTHVIKFVLEYNASWHGNGLIMYYISNAETSATSSGTITSPVIHLASAEGATKYKELYWNQELNGGSVNLTLQQYDVGTSSWQNISGYTNISVANDGDKTFSLENMTAYDSIRIVGNLTGYSASGMMQNGTSDVDQGQGYQLKAGGNGIKLKNWGVGFFFPNAPLPVAMTKFWMSCDENVPYIQWQTASENNSELFTVEYSEDGSTWEVLKTVPGAGNSSEINNYSVRGKENNTFNSKVSYYRIVQQDFDGKTEAFGPLSSNCKGNTVDFSIYPNPNNGKFQVSVYSKENNNARLEITDAQGRIVYTETINLSKGNNLIPVNMKAIKGIYLVHLRNSEDVFGMKKIIIN